MQRDANGRLVIAFSLLFAMLVIASEKSEVSLAFSLLFIQLQYSTNKPFFMFNAQIPPCFSYNFLKSLHFS